MAVEQRSEQPNGIVTVTVREPGDRPRVYLVDKRPRWERIDQSRTDEPEEIKVIESQDD